MSDSEDQKANLQQNNHPHHHHHHHHHHHRRHVGRNVFLSVLGVLILALLVFAGLAWHNLSVTTSSMYTPTGAVRKRNASQVLAQRKPVSILLLGTDTGALGRTYKGRTDTMMIMTINPQTKKTTVVSLPRDMKVNIPGYAQYSPAKINAAYAFGGTKATVNTVQKYFNVPVDYYLLVNMGGLEKAINHVGGVTVTSPLTFSYEGYSFSKGKSYHMNGKQALAFARMRYDDPHGDYGRQTRQRLIITSLLRKSISYKTVLNRDFLKSMSSSVHTDLKLSDMRTLALHYRTATHNVVTDHAQGHGEEQGGQDFEIVSQTEQNRITNLLKKSLNIN